MNTQTKGTQTKESQAMISPEEVVNELLEGNKRFVAGQGINRNYNDQVEITSKGQFPIAAILGCIDSRVPAEIVFDQGIGDIFNARVAGNFVNDDILGSLEFACKVAGSKAIIVLGHSKCGAVKGACDDVKLGNLTSMLANIKPAVDSVDETNDRSSANEGFVQKVVEQNVVLTLDAIRKRSEILNEMEQAGEISIVGAIYNVDTGVVELLK